MVARVVTKLRTGGEGSPGAEEIKRLGVLSRADIY